MSAPLTAWWWKVKNNYGDILNPLVLSHVSGRPVEWADKNDAEIIAIGSVMRTVRERIIETGNPVYVWGTGMMAPIQTDFKTDVALTLVRGPLTATLLGLDDMPMGDPGLLADQVFDLAGTPKTHKYGIIAHWSHNDNNEIRGLLKAHPDSKLINMITTDVRETTRQIAACEIILSSSLHGLIVADSFGIPNIWIDTGPIGNTNRFKFFDYALSVERNMIAPESIETLITAGIPTPDTAYFASLPAIKDTIINAFPTELAA